MNEETMERLVEEVTDFIQDRSEPDVMSMEEAIEFYGLIQSDLNRDIWALRDDIARRDAG